MTKFGHVYNIVMAHEKDPVAFLATTVAYTFKPSIQFCFFMFRKKVK